MTDPHAALPESLLPTVGGRWLSFDWTREPARVLLAVIANGTQLCLSVPARERPRHASFERADVCPWSGHCQDFFPGPNFLLFLRYRNKPQERSLQKRVLVPTHLVGRRGRPSQLWRPPKLQSPRPQVKARGRSQDSKKRWRKKQTLCWGKKTQDRLPKSQRPSSSLLLVNLQGKLPSHLSNVLKSPGCPSRPNIRDSTRGKLNFLELFRIVGS